MDKSVNELDEINCEMNPVVNIVNIPKFGVLTRSNEVKIRRDTFKLRIRNDLQRQLSFFLTDIIISLTELHLLGMLF